MLCKEVDSKTEAVSILERLLAQASKEKKPFIERELRTVRAGIKGEKDSAYLIDFHFRDSQTTAVIHDLRIELEDGRAAQIDHLLIHRTYRFYVLETKHFSHGLKITEEGEFLRWDEWKKNFVGMPSPIEQNERHALVLRKALTSLGMPEPKIQSLILIAPHARIDRPKRFDTKAVIKADQFVSAFEKNIEGTGVLELLGGLLKTSFSDSVTDIAQKLIALHRPIAINYAARFGMPELSDEVAAPVPLKAHVRATTVPAADELVAAVSVTDVDVSVTASHIQHSCKQCNDHTKLSMQSGKYGYYLKCAACGGNTPIKIDCGQAAHKERIRKAGNNFYRECSECKSSLLYFTNPI